MWWIREELLVRPVEYNGPLVPPHLDVLDGHGGVLLPHHPGIFQHLLEQGRGQSHTGQLGDVVDDEVRVGGGVRDVVPVLGNGAGGQVEVDGRNGRNGNSTTLELQLLEMVIAVSCVCV